MNGTEILWPVLVQVVVTLVLYVLTFWVRIGLVKKGEARASEFRTYEDEHVESRKWARAIANQYELPTLFYALCLAALVMGMADTVMVLLAWAFAIIKTVHVVIHVTANRLRYRQPMFSVAFLIIVLMTVWFARSLAGLV